MVNKQEMYSAVNQGKLVFLSSLFGARLCINAGGKFQYRINIPCMALP